MWALFYRDSQVSREYRSESDVWRALRHAGIMDQIRSEQGYEVRRVSRERQAVSSFV